MTAFAEAESIVRGLADELTQVRPGECLYCYAIRMLDAFGCDNRLRWAKRYRDLSAPRATSLESRLASMGGYCDCEVFLNGVTLMQRPGDVADEDDPAAWEVPPCGRVRRGSTRGCAHWMRRFGWDRW